MARIRWTGEPRVVGGGLRERGAVYDFDEVSATNLVAAGLAEIEPAPLTSPSVPPSALWPAAPPGADDEE